MQHERESDRVAMVGGPATQTTEALALAKDPRLRRPRMILLILTSLGCVSSCHSLLTFSVKNDEEYPERGYLFPVESKSLSVAHIHNKRSLCTILSRLNSLSVFILQRTQETSEVNRRYRLDPVPVSADCIPSRDLPRHCFDLKYGFYERYSFITMFEQTEQHTFAPEIK